MMNDRAKIHFDAACEFLALASGARDQGQTNDAIVLTGLGELAVKIATFAVDNHALVAGIDESVADVSHPTQQGGGVWGGPPLPAHIAATIQRGPGPGEHEGP